MSYTRFAAQTGKTTAAVHDAESVARGKCGTGRTGVPFRSRPAQAGFKTVVTGKLDHEKVSGCHPQVTKKTKSQVADLRDRAAGMGTGPARDDNGKRTIIAMANSRYRKVI